MRININLPNEALVTDKAAEAAAGSGPNTALLANPGREASPNPLEPAEPPPVAAPAIFEQAKSLECEKHRAVLWFEMFRKRYVHTSNHFWRGMGDKRVWRRLN